MLVEIMSVEGFWAAVDRSETIDEEHVVTASVALFVGFVFWADIEFITSMLYSLDSIDILVLIAEIAITGLFGGFVTLLAYSTDNRSLTVGGSMQTKEKAIAAVVGTILVVGAGAELVSPWILSALELVFVQAVALTFIGGLLYVHLIVDRWRLDNELPHAFAALLLIAAPYL